MGSKSSQDSLESDAFARPYKRNLDLRKSIQKTKKFLKRKPRNPKNV